MAQGFGELANQILAETIQNPTQRFQQSIAPYGLRYSDVTTGQPPVEAKGLGYFGGLPTDSGQTMTEFSTSFEINGQPISAPLVVPTLTPDELEILMSGQQPTESIYTKAYLHAMDRVEKGMSPFATGSDLRIPAPQAPMQQSSGVMSLEPEEEDQFQNWIRNTGWFKEFVDQYGEEPDLNITDYDYRAAWKAGIEPVRDPYDQNRYHWASSTGEGQMLKSATHPTAWKETFMRQTGQNPDALGISSKEQADVYIQQMR